MLNIDAFIDRLEQLMENHQLNAASFSEKIGVQRSSLSHILSRRNKPSLDFILKIQAQFDEVDFDWLLLGTSKKVSFAADDLKRQETATEKKEDF
ncbi:MAG: helix-turn-helix transcriptional regulator, partial [Bacteroidetes bacterium]|nr:helix-turn-helix transcriptional regulator [Bacteroidota bacterium]